MCESPMMKIWPVGIKGPHPPLRGTLSRKRERGFRSRSLAPRCGERVAGGRVRGKRSQRTLQIRPRVFGVVRFDFLDRVRRRVRWDDNFHSIVMVTIAAVF